MKKLILTLCIFSVLGLDIQAEASQYISTIEKLENSLYGYTYNADNENERLERLENSVYGTVSTGNISSRVEKLKQDMSADLIGQEIEPVEDTFADPQDSYIEEAPVASSNISYPAVDELEDMVFDTHFANEDIKNRLSKLEMKIFGKEFNDDLSTRTDRLKAEIKPKSLIDNLVAQSSNDYYNDYIPPAETDYMLQGYNPVKNFDYDTFNNYQESLANQYRNSHAQSVSSDKKYSLNSLEKGIFSQNFKNESMENRLSRLESAMFGTIFSGENEETRIKRLSSAYNAQKTAGKYDNNKFTQNMATAMQIGTIILMMLACIL